MPLMYRSMTPDGDYPKVGPTARTLGVRVPPNKRPDITPDEEGNVIPETGGMSAAPHWRDLPFFKIPKRLRHKVPDARGTDADCCWRMGEGAFEEGAVSELLTLRPDKSDHGVVEPATEMSLESYQAALAGTRELWAVDED